MLSTCAEFLFSSESIGVLCAGMSCTATRWRVRSFTAIAIVSLGISITGVGAWAGEVDDLIKNGLELRRKGRDAEAYTLFQRAHELDSGARVLAQLGFAEQALGM